MPPRDRNDARVTFTTTAMAYGLSLDQVKALWRIVTPPYPTEGES